MLKKLYSIAIGIAMAYSAFAQVGSGTLKGTITDEKTGETIPFANVVVKQGEKIISGSATDINGKFTIKPLAPGKYDMHVQNVGYTTKVIKDLIINSDKITFQDVALLSGIDLGEVDVVEYSVPLIDRDGGATGGTVTSEDIEKMPLRDATSIATTVAGVVSDDNGDVNIRGGRSENTYYYIDGVKVIGSTNLPKSSIQEVSVITGGVPANYGDVTGGVINITTKGATSAFYGGIEAITSGFKDGDEGRGLDRFGYNLVEGFLSGPIAFKKDSAGNKERSVMGFFASVNYTSELDNRPTFGFKKISDDVYQSLIENPTSLNAAGTGLIYNAEELTGESFREVATRQNDSRQQLNLAGKIDISPSELFDISLGVQYNWENDNAFSYGNSLMNSDNNSYTKRSDLRTYLRFVQRFRNSSSGTGIKNAYYSVLLDYTSSNRELGDPTHTDNFFNYGHLGSYETTLEPFYTFDPIRQAWLHDGFESVNVDFTPGTANPIPTRITEQYFEFFGDQQDRINSLTAIEEGEGLINGQAPRGPYAIFSHPGTRWNRFTKNSDQQFRISANGSADIGEHALQIGFEFEQRAESRWSLGDYAGRGPRNLWLLARQNTNSHLTELDRSDSTVTFPDGTWAYITYPRLIDLDNQSTFDRNLRESLGLDPDGDVWIDMDALDPSQLRLDYFSKEELINDGLNFVEYYGYDAYGNKVSGNLNFNEFFTATDADGNFSRNIGAYSPNYVAGYIMDKFALNDIIFNVGLRVDRFDANQGVLKDPYVVGETYKVGQVSSLGGEGVSHPESVSSGAVIYVDDIDDPGRITGYRDGEQWYDANGAPLQDPTPVAVGGNYIPYLVNGSDDDANLNSAFEDYDPQINWMPRIAFSFPISDVAVFFAHYDVLTQRPTVSNRLNPIDYLAFRQAAATRTFEEPNLQSERTIDYEFGFQQVLSKSSSIKISAFYRQMQDNIQVRAYVGAYPSTYRTFDNIDFGTVKGFTASFDLRRTGNVRMNVSYTLQFADGTGSSSTTAQSLANQGQANLRTVYPLDFDQRHRVVTTFDYRYGRGSNYNGPMIGASQILADFGVNLIGIFNTGNPYSASKRTSNLFERGTGGGDQLTGQLNGARLPAQFRLDLQIDKSFPIRLGTAKDGSQKMGNLNVNLWINNILNTANINFVYRATNSPDDDGYLATSRGQLDLNNRINPASYEYYYNAWVQNPFNFNRPRTIRLGVRFDF
jgi:hypothetical protein